MTTPSAPRRERFGLTADGRAVHRWTLGQEPGAMVRVLDLGATLQELWVPDASGHRANVVLGAPDVAGYEKVPSDYLGAVVGRCANRVAGASVTIEGRDHVLPANDGPNTLHGGPDGFQLRLWQVDRADVDELVLSLDSPAGDQGLPGDVAVTVRYRVEGTTVRFDWSATTTATTVVNLTHHAHLNLAGESSGSIGAHTLRVAADSFTPIGPDLLPTGRVAPVAGTALDLRHPRPLDDVRLAEDPQVQLAHGLDHNYVLTSGEPAAVLADPVSGRVLELHTDRPGLQVYTGNFFDGSQVGTGGTRYAAAAGVALEPQAWPDAIHHQGEEGWPSVLLEPGRTMRSTTVWRFDCGDNPGRRGRRLLDSAE